MRFVVILACSFGAALGGCSTLPTAGPTTGQVVDQSVKDDQARFDIVDVDDKVVSTLLARPGESFRSRFRKYGKPPDPKIGIGDTISVPFADRISVAGKSPLEVQQTIERRLADKAIEPQVIVVITKSVTNTATVSGEVVNGARVPLSLNGNRLLDLIALAGGAKSPVYETFVRLTRDGVTVTIPME